MAPAEDDGKELEFLDVGGGEPVRVALVDQGDHAAGDCREWVGGGVQSVTRTVDRDWYYLVGGETMGVVQVLGETDVVWDWVHENSQATECYIACYSILEREGLHLKLFLFRVKDDSIYPLLVSVDEYDHSSLSIKEFSELFFNHLLESLHSRESKDAVNHGKYLALFLMLHLMSQCQVLLFEIGGKKVGKELVATR